MKLLVYVLGAIIIVSTPSLSFSEEMTVKLARFGMEWQKLESEKKSLQDAITYCENLALGGYSNWRLPAIHELNTLINRSKNNPAADKTLFPDIHSEVYWSCSPSSAVAAFVVNFSDGELHSSLKSSLHYVRCVRYEQ